MNFFITYYMCCDGTIFSTTCAKCIVKNIMWAMFVHSHFHLQTLNGFR